ncbi:MAG: DNA-binding protein WhiA [Clostridiales bacterium]|nr:DNA-binding protein WhiA [Clostridiales bacterium]
MSTFTEELKNEIIQKPIERECCRIAFLSAYIRTSGSIISSDGNFGFEIVTESERTAEFVCDLFETLFKTPLSVSSADVDLKSGKDKLKFVCVGDSSCEILDKLGILKRHGDGVSLVFGIGDKLIVDDDCMSAYIKGAFLGGGSCTLPEEQTYSRTGYHFEVVFSNRITASDYCELLCAFEVLAKLVTRNDSAVVYVKSKEVISDILNVMQADRCLKKLNRIVERKDRSNNENRVSNCSVSNIDKALTASVAQIKAIDVISQTIGLKNLKANLFEVAEARLADKNASMQELADRLHISKSCINHRMRKIFALASQLS